ncbi:MAG: hypothetical protein ACRD1Z_08570 [Vicinamibacteria bacterium]
MIGHVILGAISGVAALGSVLASVLGARRTPMWVVWVRGDGAMVGKPVGSDSEASKMQMDLAEKRGRNSVVVVSKPDGTFMCKNPMRATPAQKLRATRATIKMREGRGMEIPPGLLRKEARLVRATAARPR